MGATYDSMARMWRLFWPGVAALAALVAGLALRALLLGVVRRGGRPRNGWASFAQAIRLPSVLWLVVLAAWIGIEVASETAPLPRRLSTQLRVVFEALIIASVTLTVAGAVSTLIQHASERRALGGPVTGLGQAVARGVVYVVGLLVLLDVLGVEITPILTALGVGGLAVALALKDTLSNLFAGMHLLVDRPIRVGDYVKIAGDIEGYIVDVGWGSTRVRMLQNNVVVVPNGRVAESVIVNYDLPEPRMSLLLQVGVAYASDPDHVERVLLEETRAAVGQVPGLLGDPPPFVRFIPGFGESSLDFTLICQVATFVDQYVVQHELRKRILRRFRAEGIEIPFTIRTVELRPPGGEPPAGDASARAGGLREAAALADAREEPEASRHRHREADP